ncbi:hypothetical protein R5R35_011789 [Gryllus longicercus]|uniref:Uncharacterized protein n=1 Tax=Gryllus longicercus TaxID=2509291 RepID=A0AAN9VWZ8_9ORTH
MPRTSRPERRAFVLISPPATRVRQLAACACPLSWLAVRRHRTGALRARSRRRQCPPPRYVSPEGAPPPPPRCLQAAARARSLASGFQKLRSPRGQKAPHHLTPASAQLRA